MNSSPSTPRQGFPLKAFGILLLLALLGGVGAYFYGLSQGRAALAAQKGDYETQLQNVQAATQGSKNELAAANNRALLLNAQNGLYRAAVALDRRNFGIANTALQGAAKSLGEVKESPQIPLARVQSLAAALQKTNINVAANLEDQRARVLAFAEQMEDLTAPRLPAEAEVASVEAASVEAASAEAPDGTNAESLAPDGGTPAPDGLTQSNDENAVSSDNTASNSLPASNSAPQTPDS